jgi:hypothetical protein
MRIPAISALCISGALAQGVETDRGYGEASFQFLKLSMSPRSTALGGSGMALVDGIGDADLNPAAAARDSGALALGQGYPFLAFSATGSHIAWNLPWGKSRRILVQARYLGFDDIPGWDGLNQPTASYGAHTLKVQSGLAGKFRGLAYGVTAAYAQNHIADADYAIALVNAGLWYGLPFGLALGVAGMNVDFWKSSEAETAGVFPPTAVQAGLSYTRSLPAESKLSVALDARTRNDEQLSFPAGVEASWKETLWLRVGYPFAEPEPSPSLGLGLRWSRFGFHYAYQGHAVLSGGHFWSLELRY